MNDQERAILDLHEVEGYAALETAEVEATIRTLVAEVRRLRAELDKAHHVLGVRAMEAIGVEPPE